MEQLKSVIETAFEQRADISPKTAGAEVRDAVEAAIGLLDSGKARVPRSGTATGW